MNAQVLGGGRVQPGAHRRSGVRRTFRRSVRLCYATKMERRGERRRARTNENATNKTFWLQRPRIQIYLGPLMQYLPALIALIVGCRNLENTIKCCPMACRGTANERHNILGEKLIWGEMVFAVPRSHNPGPGPGLLAT